MDSCSLTNWILQLPEEWHAPFKIAFFFLFFLASNVIDLTKIEHPMFAKMKNTPEGLPPSEFSSYKKYT